MLAFVLAFSLRAQQVSKIEFRDKKYEYGPGRDTLRLYFNLLDRNEERISTFNSNVLDNFLDIVEDGELLSAGAFSPVGGGQQRIPSEYTFSILVDLNIPLKERYEIFDKAVSVLVRSARDSTVFLSTFGDFVSPSRVLAKANVKEVPEELKYTPSAKYFYSGLYAKMAEFGGEDVDEAETAPDYVNNEEISRRAAVNPENNILFVFTEGNARPSFEKLNFLKVKSYKDATEEGGGIIPEIYAFYYIPDGENPRIEETLKGLAGENHYMPSSEMDSVLESVKQVVADKSYDYEFQFIPSKNKIYNGKAEYSALWKNEAVEGVGTFSVGSPERPWPERAASSSSALVKYIVALFVVLLTILIFFLVIKVLIPFVHSASFKAKYYKTYQPEDHVQRRICHYCKQPIEPGQKIVARCKHIMHVHCWKQNGYKCAEYGQNCADGIQPHVDWRSLFTIHSLRDCYQMISGVFAAFVAWVVFELLGRSGFSGISKAIVAACLSENAQLLASDCESIISAFLLIGLLLGFFLSLIFRYNDEYRRKDWKILLKILGFSLVTALGGALAFTMGGVILCWLVSALHTTFIPWYCSLPAYILFALTVMLLLSWQSSIPLKSALLGGGIAAIIGFLVLFLSSLSPSRWEWMNMLLDFVIFGGGLGASLITVRMLAEKYFLIIKNGLREGQKIPIHKWMNATGGGQKVSIGMTGECEIQMNWEKSNKVAKEHARLFIDQDKLLPMIKPLATGVIYNTRVELPVGKNNVLSNGDTFKIGDTIFQYIESE